MQEMTASSNRPTNVRDKANTPAKEEVPTFQVAMVTVHGRVAIGSKEYSGTFVLNEKNKDDVYVLVQKGLALVGIGAPKAI